MQPRLGRDNSANTAIVAGVLVSDQLWRTRLQSERNLGRCSLMLNGNRVAVVGVMPPDFDFPSGIQIWWPGHTSLNANLVARLRPGLSLGQAQVGLKTVLSKETLAHGEPTLQPLHDYLLGDRRPLLWILTGVSILFLALACAGVTNLLLARGVRRRSEMVVRAVLGAERGRLVRQLLTETLLLATAGGLLGLALSTLASRGLRLLLLQLTGSSAFLSPATVVLVVGLTFVVTILCGVAPAFNATGSDLNSSLKAGNSGPGISTPRRHRITSHEVFAGAQLLLAMVLLVSTGLLLRSMVARLNFPLGFQPKDAVVVQVDLPVIPENFTASKDWWTQNPQPHRHQTKDVLRNRSESEMKSTGPEAEAEAARNELYYSSALRRLAELPGVVSVAFMDPPPFTIRSFWSPLFDSPALHANVTTAAVYTNVSANAFSVLDIPLLAGRSFQQNDIPPPDAWKFVYYGSRSWSDVQETPGVAIISATLAHRLWPNQNPLGKMIYTGSPLRVIAVVADVHPSRNNVGSDVFLSTVYRPYTANNPFSRHSSFVVKLRPGIPFASFAAAVKRSLPTLPREAAPATILPLQESLGTLPMVLALLSCFSVLGIIVAGLGVYATATLMAAARTRETGIRLAIGASAKQIGRLTLWRSARLALLALPIGAFGAWVLGHSLTHWLFQVGAADPLSYLSSAAILLAIALAAGIWPALRAARVDPAKALRYDG